MLTLSIAPIQNLSNSKIKRHLKELQKQRQATSNTLSSDTSTNGKFTPTSISSLTDNSKQTYTFKKLKNKVKIDLNQNKIKEFDKNLKITSDFKPNPRFDLNKSIKSSRISMKRIKKLGINVENQHVHKRVRWSEDYENTTTTKGLLKIKSLNVLFW